MAEDTEKEIVQLLRNEGPLATSEIVEKIRKSGKDGKSGNENSIGKSVPSVFRALKNLRESGKIIRIQKEDFKHYGLKGGDNAIFYADPQYKIDKQHVVKVLETLKDGTEKEKIIALKVLEQIEKRKFDEDELFEFAEIIKNSQNEQLLGYLSRMLVESLQKGVTPSNISEIELLLAQKLNDENVHVPTFGAYILRILAVRQNKIVIVWIEKLAKLEKQKWQNWLSEFYQATYARVLEKYKPELFEFIKKLNDNERIDDLIRIQQNAMDYVRQGRA